MKSPSKKPNSQLHMMAVRLYNKGLQQAEGRCLTGAKESLLSCIGLEKDFIDARNLLGLIYWETGQVGEALKQWIISSSYQKEDNLASKYLDLVDENQDKLTQYSQAISFYNTSLEYFNKDIKDIAGINLRKSASANPNYTQAHTLLGLYYIDHGDLEKAAENLKAVLEIDKDNYMANKYIKSLNVDLGPAKPSKKEPASKIVRSAQAGNLIENKSLLGSLGAFVVGAVLMLGVYAVLVVPAKTSEFKEEVKLAQAEKETIEKDYSSLVTQKDQEIQNLTKENTQMEEKLNILEEDQIKQSQINVLNRAKELVGERNWIDASAKIEQIDPEHLEAELKEEYTALKDDAYNRAGEQLYNQGYAEYKKVNLEEALELLEKSYEYEKEEYYSDNALFTIGRIHEDQDNMEEATKYYNKVIEDYDGTDGAYNAKRRLD